jgi:hypothetical protein
MPGVTRLNRLEHALGSSTYAIRAPDHRLAPLMYRELLGFEQHRAEFSSLLEAPRPALTLMVDVDGAITADGQRLPDAWFGGVADTYTVVEFAGSYASLDLELTPLGAYRVLGRPLDALKGQVVSLEALFGVEGRVLAGRLRDAHDRAGARLPRRARAERRRRRAAPLPLEPLSETEADGEPDLR